MKAYRMFTMWQASYIHQSTHNRKGLNLEFNDIWMSD